MKLYIFIILCSVLLLSSCSTLTDILSTKVTEEQKQIVLKMAKKIHFKRMKKLSSSGLNTTRLRRGQWVATLTTEKTGAGEITLTKTKVIKATKFIVILETENYSASSNGERALSQITMKNYPLVSKIVYTKKEADRVMGRLKIIKIISKGSDGVIHEVPKNVLSMTGGQIASGYKNHVSSGKTKRKSCKTKYIKSIRCYHYPITVNMMGMSRKSNIVVHNKVPVSAQVYSEDESSITEVIGFGYKGAKTSF